MFFSQVNVDASSGGIPSFRVLSGAGQLIEGLAEEWKGAVQAIPEVQLLRIYKKMITLPILVRPFSILYLLTIDLITSRTLFYTLRNDKEESHFI